MLIVLRERSRATELGDGVHDALTVAPFYDANFVLENSGSEFKKNITGDLLLCRDWSVACLIIRGYNAPINLSQTAWSNPFDLSQSTTSSNPHSDGCVTGDFLAPS